MKNFLLFCSGILFFTTLSAQIVPGKLLTENLMDPVGLDIEKPRFTWQLVTSQRNVMQTAYEIHVFMGNKLIWNSGKVESGQSVLVPYSGSPLNSSTKYSWKVKVWDNHGKASDFSAPATFATGLFKSSEWKAEWIIPGFPEDDPMRPSPLMRKEFSLPKDIKTAIAYLTSHGLYEAHINGNRVGDAYFTPGWTVYGKRLQYQAFDVSRMLVKGSNALGVTLGSGWYRGTIGYENNVNYYGSDIALLCQLEIEFTDGTRQTVVSDGSWTSSTGEIIYSEIYNGETIDARLEKKGWLLPGYNDNGWVKVKTAEFSKEVLLATRNEMVKKQEILAPVAVITTPKGEKVIDFGQNLVGWVEMKATGKAGDKIVLSHAEVLDREGNFYTENLRAARAQDTYILAGGKEEIFEPHFTWHGFRYLRIEGYPGDIRPENFRAVVLYSDMNPTGTFSTSNDLINQLQHNIQWGQKGNFLDVPTDCPQRDERLGWTGDAQVFSRTAAFNMNVHSFFAKWLRDLEADQVEGKVPFVVPNVLGKGAVNSAGWADVACIAPWNMYLVYGDRSLLETQYSSMKAYVESIRGIAVDNLWNSGFHFGDWLFYSRTDDTDGRSAVTDKYLIAQCFYAHSVDLLVKAASVLGFSSDAALYSGLLEKIKEAFLKEYVTASGRLVSGTQTAYVLALHFDMLPEDLRPQAARRLAENVESYDNHLTTGFLGTPYLCHVLTRFGYPEIAFRLLLQESYPSWLYPVKSGATTIWERWDGQKPDGTFQNAGMNSFNHYAYGAIGDWMYRILAGIDTYEDQPGYKHSLIRPLTGGGFTNVSASLDTYYGKLSSEWSVSEDKLLLNIEIPANTTSTVYFPATDSSDIFEGGKPISSNKEIRIEEIRDGWIILAVGSGKYSFSR